MGGAPGTARWTGKGEPVAAANAGSPRRFQANVFGPAWLRLSFARASRSTADAHTEFRPDRGGGQHDRFPALPLSVSSVQSVVDS
jgi:hypothetical protein